MAPLVQFEQAPGELLWGVVVVASMTGWIWRTRIDQVPRLPGLHYHDVIEVDASTSPARVLGVLERSAYGEAVRVTHDLPDEAACDAALEPLEAVGWIARFDDAAAGEMWLVCPPGDDPYEALTPFHWVTDVRALATPPSTL